MSKTGLSIKLLLIFRVPVFKYKYLNTIILRIESNLKNLTSGLVVISFNVVLVLWHKFVLHLFGLSNNLNIAIENMCQEKDFQ